MTIQQATDQALAIMALTKIVRSEYGDLPMSEIAATWGSGLFQESVTAEEIEALRRLEESGAIRG